MAQLNSFAPRSGVAREVDRGKLGGSRSPRGRTWKISRQRQLHGVQPHLAVRNIAGTIAVWERHLSKKSP